MSTPPLHTAPNGLESLGPEDRQVLLGLQLLSHGATASLSPVAGRGGRDHLMPTGELRPPHERYVAMLARPGADVASIMAEARAELDTWKRRPAMPRVEVESLDDLKARIVHCEGWEARDVAIAMRCTESLVRVARVEAGRDADFGREPAQPLPVEPRARALALVDLGMSYRQAEAICGVSIATISRKRRAA